MYIIMLYNKYRWTSLCMQTAEMMMRERGTGWKEPFFAEIPNAMMLVDSLEHYTAHSKRCDPIFHSIPDITFFSCGRRVCLYSGCCYRSCWETMAWNWSKLASIMLVFIVCIRIPLNRDLSVFTFLVFHCQSIPFILTVNAMRFWDFN